MELDDLCDVVVEGIFTEDYPDFCDAYIASACWASSGKPLTEAELEAIDSSVVYDAVIKHLF